MNNNVPDSKIYPCNTIIRLNQKSKKRELLAGMCKSTVFWDYNSNLE